MVKMFDDRLMILENAGPTDLDAYETGKHVIATKIELVDANEGVWIPWLLLTGWVVCL